MRAFTLTTIDPGCRGQFDLVAGIRLLNPERGSVVIDLGCGTGLDPERVQRMLTAAKRPPLADALFASYTLSVIPAFEAAWDATVALVAHPWWLLERDATDVVQHTLRDGHIVITAGTRTPAD